MKPLATSPARLPRKSEPLMLLGVLFLVALVLFAAFGPMIRTAQIGHGIENFDAVFVNRAKPFEPMGGQYPMGTDDIGRDIMARLAYGARISLFVGLTVQVIALIIGITVGVVGAMSPKWISTPLMRFTDGMFAFPDILLAILIIGVIPTSSPLKGTALPVIAALSVTAWPSIARLVQTQVATLKDREFVVAARAQGAPTFYLVLKHILPQLGGILMAVSMIEVAGTILAESALSFLGIGVQAPTPSWGSMINMANGNKTSYPYLLIWPCLILSLTIFALNFVGDGLRAALDPKSK